ncbi:MAG: hypothetical protein ABSF49_05830 [Roseiarcus sp.]|jgi:hypothetical protein|uniref:hypothetical protein n=1 Tax=Roseiarcus sp. TaxID=1969460 RepID=UPI003C2233DC
MVRSLMMGFAAALALAAAISTADAQTVRHRHMHYAAVHPGDIVVHARSYLDPGAGASFGEIGTGDRYVTDSAPSSLGEMGPMFGNGAFDTLPTRFNPPGRPEPLFEF